jgi:hypothetical protein
VIRRPSRKTEHYSPDKQKLNSTMSATYKSKTLTAWLALLGGSVGLHRFYLRGFLDLRGWLYPIPCFLGVLGIQRMQAFGQDDTLSWVLMPCLGLVLAASMLEGIIVGLMPDERWHARHNPSFADPSTLPASGWGVIFAVVLCLLVGAAVLMATIAFSGQRYFEYQIIEAQKLSQ